MPAVQMPGAEVCRLRLCLSGLLRLPCSRNCRSPGGAVQRTVGVGCTAALFAGRSSLPELDDRVGRSEDCGTGGGGYVGGAKHCELCAADRVNEGFAGADPGRADLRLCQK